MSTKNIIKVIGKSLELTGAIVERCFTLTIDGFQDLILSVVDYGADLSQVDRSKIIDFLQILNTRRTLACALYPLDEIKNNIKSDPRNYKYKIDYIEQLERQSTLVMKLMEWMAFTPIEKKAVKRMFKNVQEVRDEVGLSQLHYDEIKLIIANITKELDHALDNESEEDYKILLVDYIRCQIILDSSDKINNYLDLLKTFDENNYSLLKGKFLLRTSQYEESFKYLKRAYELDIAYSNDLLAQSLDELVKIGHNNEYWLQIKREIFGGYFSLENKEKIKTLPFLFLQIKWQEIHKVYSNIRDTQEKESA